jgi:hypothetical protein
MEDYPRRQREAAVRYRHAGLVAMTDVEWIKQATLAFGFLLPGRTRVFSLAEAPEAHQWIGTDGQEKRSAAA